jgi:hypothetical protein
MYSEHSYGKRNEEPEKIRGGEIGEGGGQNEVDPGLSVHHGRTGGQQQQRHLPAQEGTRVPRVLHHAVSTSMIDSKFRPAGDWSS